MVFVFDLDDTISVHRNRDFENAAPIPETIEKIRRLREEGHEIVIYSSRGQNSCKGDLELIEARNREQVERWLHRNGVPYGRLVFGKPLGDVYVDDKGISLKEFLDGEYCKLEGNSGATIFRAGERVVKQCKSPREEADWYEAARKRGLRVPKVNSVVLDKIDIEFLHGTPGNQKDLSAADLSQIISQIMLMSLFEPIEIFDVDKYVQFTRGRLEIAGWQNNFPRLIDFLKRHADEIRHLSSFCHGDLSLSNIIFTADGLYLIDPSARTEFSSFLIDFAKLQFSLNGGEQLLHGGERPPEYDLRLSELSRALSREGWGTLVTAMETVHWIRMLRYFDGKEAIIWEKAKQAEAML